MSAWKCHELTPHSRTSSLPLSKGTTNLLLQQADQTSPIIAFQITQSVCCCLDCQRNISISSPTRIFPSVRARSCPETIVRQDARVFRENARETARGTLWFTVNDPRLSRHAGRPITVHFYFLFAPFLRFFFFTVPFFAQQPPRAASIRSRAKYARQPPSPFIDV